MGGGRRTRTSAANTAAPATTASERARLIAIATFLEETAGDGDATESSFDAKLAELNAALSSDCNRRTFQYLYQSMSVEELVDDLLERRDKLVGVTAPSTLSKEDLPAFLAARSDHGHYTYSAGFDELQRDVNAVAPLTNLPRDLIGAVLECDNDPVPAAERAALLVSYRPPASLEDVWITVRALGESLASRRSARGAIAVQLLEHELVQHPSEELTLLLGFAKRSDVRLMAYAKKLGILPR